MARSIRTRTARPLRSIDCWRKEVAARAAVPLEAKTMLVMRVQRNFTHTSTRRASIRHCCCLNIGLPPCGVLVTVPQGDQGASGPLSSLWSNKKSTPRPFLFEEDCPSAPSACSSRVQPVSIVPVSYVRFYSSAVGQLRVSSVEYIWCTTVSTTFLKPFLTGFDHCVGHLASMTTQKMSDSTQGGVA